MFAQGAVKLAESLAEGGLGGCNARAAIVRAQFYHHDVGLVAPEIPPRRVGHVECPQDALAHGQVGGFLFVAPVTDNALTRMGREHVIGIETARHDAAPCQVAVLGLGGERLRDGFPLGTVAARVRVADELDQPRRGGRQVEQGTVGLDAVERRAPLFGFGAFLHRHGMRPRRKPFGEGHARRGSLDGRLTVQASVDEYVVVITPGIRSTHRAAAAVETEREMTAAPVERQTAVVVFGGAAGKADLVRTGFIEAHVAAGHADPRRRAQCQRE